MNPFESFVEAVRAARPRAAVVLGSGLAEVASALEVRMCCAFADVPGMVPPTVAGHRGHLALGTWAGVPTVVSFGRVHYYEGHAWERVTKCVHLLASWNINRLILTNAAGGLHPRAVPGQILLLEHGVDLLTADAWKTLEQKRNLFTPHLVSQLSAQNPKRIVGTYAGLTGPCYETPAEIRALASVGVDAVGMSTIREAEAAQRLNLEVVGFSIITNKAAGLGEGALSHAEVEVEAKKAVPACAELITQALRLD